MIPNNPNDRRVLTVVSLLILALVVVGVACNCQAPPKANVAPAQEFYGLVQRSVHTWLSPRIDMDDHNVAEFQSSEWRQYDNTTDLGLWFQMELDQPLWDIRRLIKELKTAELYQSQPPSDSEFTRLLILALASYKHPEDDED